MKRNKREIEVKLVKDGNVNQFYDPSRMNNGGGYFQPCTEREIILPNGKELYLIYNDTSCGDFGTRIYIELGEKNGGIILQKYYNTVNRVPDVSFKYTGEYQNVIKYLYDRDILTDWDLTPDWVNIGAWESVYWGVNMQMMGLIQKILNY